MPLSKMYMKLNLHGRKSIKLFNYYFVFYFTQKTARWTHKQALRSGNGTTPHHHHRIDYKVASLVHKVRSTGSPAYLQALVSDYTPARQLRSSKQLFLHSYESQQWELKSPDAPSAKLLQLPGTTYRSIHAQLLHIRFRSATKKHFYELAFMNWSRDCLRSHDSFLPHNDLWSVIKYII